jgi:tetratricopeptide (TPR) repeat protein
MWPAATAEEWKKPCLVPWQRTFDDALRAARAKNQPILVAVNMDGEVASEHFAGVRYREAATAALLSKYVCIVASVYRHTPRDYDAQGRRVLCPRFGTVTCGEHIEAERELYEKYFEGKRISPRHIVLGLDGRKTYDVYYSWDTDTVFTTYRKGAEGWPKPNETAEPALADFVKSADIRDRERLERAYAEGARETKRAILEMLVNEPVVDQIEVLRAAIYGLDLELAGLARRALAKCTTEGSLDVIAAALQIPIDPAERKLLLDAVERMGKTSVRARTLGALHSGLAQTSPHIDSEALARQYDAASYREVDVDARAREAQSRPNDPAALLALAESLVARGQASSDRRFATLFMKDALATAHDAEKSGAKGARLDAVLAVAAADLGDLETARARALAAIDGGLLASSDGAAAGAGANPNKASADVTELSKAKILGLFADARQRAIRDAFRAGKSWPPEWLSDVNAAYAALLEGPFADPTPQIEFYDFLCWIGAAARANVTLDKALARFPDSAEAQDRLRRRLLWEGGPKRLEDGYAELLSRQDSANGAATQLRWYAGYASLLAAEQYRRLGELDAAVAAYGRAIAHFDRNLEAFPEGKDNCQHYIALARAGTARVALDRGEMDAAARELLAALELRPASAATLDGLGITPVATAMMLKAKLVKEGNGALANKVQKALDALDPKLLEEPAYDQTGPAPRGARGRSAVSRPAASRPAASRPR